jgi:hypothetical protein
MALTRPRASIYSVGHYTQRTDFAFGESSADASSSDNAGEFGGDYLQPNPSTNLTRHYTTLKEHADHLNGSGIMEPDARSNGATSLTPTPRRMHA